MHAAEPSTGLGPDPVPACPVCLRPAGEDADCGSCHWTLRTAFRMGAPTDTELREFEQRLATEQRAFDLAAAVRAAGFPARGDDAMLARLERFVRSGPVSEVERRSARREILARDTRVYRARATADIAAETMPASSTPAILVEVDARGVTATTFVRGADGRPREHEPPRSWPWRSLLPHLPLEPDEQRFMLAGGVGRRELDRSRLEAAATEGLGVVAGVPSVVVCRLPGWPVAEQVVALLRQRGASVLAVWSPADEAAGPRSSGPVTGSGADASGQAAVGGGRTGAPSAPPAPARPREIHPVSGLTCIAVPASVPLLVGGDADGTASLWDLRSGELLEQRRLHAGPVTSVDVAADGQTVVTAGQDGAVRVWRIGPGSPVTLATVHQGWAVAVRLARLGAFSLGDAGSLHCSSLSGAPDASGFPLPVGWDAATALAACARSDLVAVGGAGGLVRVVDSRTGDVQAQLPVGTDVTALAMDAAGNRLAVGGLDGSVRLFAPASGALVAELTANRSAVRCLAVTAQGEPVAGFASGEVRLWTVEQARTEQPGGVLGTHATAVVGVAVADADLVVSADSDGLVRQWRTGGQSR
ncbi:hypothetical protein Cs7R123_44860 [Catellatospora sp. TT07R-123]|uniref:WD40 repeat domain-containing protein n=1 Tax=Catellatospora sp. TT07R-123 TaxID=2733863 RepID=UPI001B16A3EF|nr:hypothetical protein [Catellatospora sp. TT07R-123]GHJ47144.1 hypothetical protein Cs7R123_44860 [Catellatospora sp. TT07R-123]